MNPTKLPTYPALQEMRAAFPDDAVFVELIQAFYSSDALVSRYRATLVIGSNVWFGESDDAMQAANLCIHDHATRDPKAEAIKKAKATLEAAGYAITKEVEP
jgi:hypothetical protein